MMIMKIKSWQQILNGVFTMYLFATKTWQTESIHFQIQNFQKYVSVVPSLKNDLLIEEWYWSYKNIWIWIIMSMLIILYYAYTYNK